MTKHFLSGILLFTALTLGAGPSCLQASKPLDVRWLDICTATRNQRLTITTESGAVVEGYCLNVTQNELSVRSYDRGMVKIARGTLKKMLVTNGQNAHELETLHRYLHNALKREFDGLLTEASPLALVAIPPTLAWGVITAPFCALGDLTHKLQKTSEIRVF